MVGGQVRTKYSFHCFNLTFFSKASKCEASDPKTPGEVVEGGGESEEEG